MIFIIIIIDKNNEVLNEKINKNNQSIIGKK